MSTEYLIYKTPDCEISVNESSSDLCLLFKDLNNNNIIKLTEYVMPDDIAAIAVRMLQVAAYNQKAGNIANVLLYNHGFGGTVRNQIENLLLKLGGFNDD